MQWIFYNVYLEFTSYSLSKLLIKTKIDMTFCSLECVQLYLSADMLMAMTYYMEELCDVTEMFGALQLCERVCDKCHIRRHIASTFEKCRSDITKDTSWYNGTDSNFFLQLSAHRIIKNLMLFWRWHSAFGKMIGLWTWHWEVVVQFLAEARVFSHLPSLHTHSGAWSLPFTCI